MQEWKSCIKKGTKSKEKVSLKMLQVLLVLLLGIPSELHAACSSTWTKNKNYCYKNFDSPKSWSEARASCIGEHGDLADVKDENENNFVTQNFGKKDYWLGLLVCLSNNLQATLVACDMKSNVISWSGLNKMLDLKPSSPDSGIDDFAILRNADGSWTDERKEEKHSHICKIPGILPTY